MSFYSSCPYCGKKAKDSDASKWFPVYTCLDCKTKYCDEDGPPCPECKSSNYAEYDKVYA